MDELWQTEQMQNVKMQKLRTLIEIAENKERAIKEKLVELETILHGTITCPKCSHQLL